VLHTSTSGGQPKCLKVGHVNSFEPAGTDDSHRWCQCPSKTVSPGVQSSSLGCSWRTSLRDASEPPGEPAGTRDGVRGWRGFCRGQSSIFS
jgi:hypothetical protein